MHPALAILITLICLGVILLISAWGTRSGKISGETARKSVHIGMGLICLSFPWLFSSVLAVQILGVTAVISLLIVRVTKLRQSVGSALFSVERLSIGELLFPAAVAWLFTLSWDKPMLYCISLLLLTLADSVGALAGSRFGKKIYQTASATKSLEGSIAFFITAFFCVALPLYYLAPLPGIGIAFLHGLPLSHILLLSLTIALFTMAVEGASGHGIDNFLIPIGSYLLLDYYIGLSDNEILLRSAALLILLGLLLATHRKHTLNGGAILMALLFGFASFALGGIPCLLAIGIPSLTWLTLGRGKVITYPYAQFGFLCTMALIIYMLNTGTQQYLNRKRPSMLTGYILLLLVLTPALLIDIPFSHYLPSLLIGPALAWIYFYWRSATDTPSRNHWFKLCILAFIGSAINMFIILP